MVSHLRIPAMQFWATPDASRNPDASRDAGARVLGVPTAPHPPHHPPGHHEGPCENLEQHRIKEGFCNKVIKLKLQWNFMKFPRIFFVLRRSPPAPPTSARRRGVSAPSYPRRRAPVPDVRRRAVTTISSIGSSSVRRRRSFTTTPRRRDASLRRRRSEAAVNYGYTGRNDLMQTHNGYMPYQTGSLVLVGNLILLFDICCFFIGHKGRAFAFLRFLRLWLHKLLFGAARLSSNHFNVQRRLIRLNNEWLYCWYLGLKV